MAIPSRQDIEVRLLNTILKLGGCGKVEEIHSSISAECPELTEEELYKLDKYGRNIWHTRISDARQSLAEKGELYKEKFATWSITEKGVLRIQTDPECISSFIYGFIHIADLQQTGKEISAEAYRFLINAPEQYKNLRLNFYFGKETATSVPLIAFINEADNNNLPDQPQIYPVLLYYREQKIIVLAYSINTPNTQAMEISCKKELTSVYDYFIVSFDEPPQQYGSFFLFSAHNTLDLDIEALKNDLNECIAKQNEVQLIQCKVDDNQEVYKTAKTYSKTQSQNTSSNTKKIHLNYQPVTSFEKYSKEQALDELFLEENEINEIQSLLQYKKNLILQGSPGVGKTFVAQRIAYLQMGCKDADRVEMVQFHQSYSYEDFIQGYRPNSKGGFELKNGIFYEFCRKAACDPLKDYFFIIDEINRGNLSKIFGELLMLIEHDKRGNNNKITLTYAADNDKFSIPPNLYIIGTMNTADRSLAIVDYALRRRFAFVEILPQFGEKLKLFLSKQGATDSLIKSILHKINSLNKRISSELGKGFMIGHGYFCNTNSSSINEDWYNRIIRNEIAPLLLEYWFDNEKKAEKCIEELLS